VYDDLRVGLRGEAVPASAKEFPQLQIVVYLAVAASPDRPIFVAKGLAPTDRVDDNQPAMSKTYVAVEVETLAVRTTVCDEPGHCPDEFFRNKLI
jgi:hypothetical protein